MSAGSSDGASGFVTSALYVVTRRLGPASAAKAGWFHGARTTATKTAAMAVTPTARANEAPRPGQTDSYQVKKETDHKHLRQQARHPLGSRRRKDQREGHDPMSYHSQGRNQAGEPPSPNPLAPGGFHCPVGQRPRIDVP